jgi:hypothetical protein
VKIPTDCGWRVGAAEQSVTRANITEEGFVQQFVLGTLVLVERAMKLGKCRQPSGPSPGFSARPAAGLPECGIVVILTACGCLKAKVGMFFGEDVPRPVFGNVAPHETVNYSDDAMGINVDLVKEATDLTAKV